VTGRTEPELVVVDDPAEEARRLFLDAAPRTFVLSGGRTPEAFYRLLAGTDYAWSDVEVFFGDERCVPEHDERSNLGMARRALLDHVPARIHPIDGPACDADGYERVLRERFGPGSGNEPAFDLAIYGLGPDGHTASLFPGHPEVEESERWVVRVPEAGLEPFVPRVTLTVPALSAVSIGAFLVQGASKREMVERLLAGHDIPAARLAPARLLVIADPAAAPA
jgi:6-phosphogluconolactonase